MAQKNQKQPAGLWLFLIRCLRGGILDNFLGGLEADDAKPRPSLLSSICNVLTL